MKRNGFHRFKLLQYDDFKRMAAKDWIYFSNDIKFRTTKYNTVTFKQTLTCKPDEVDKLPFLIKGLKLAKGILIKFPLREYCPK